MRCISKILHMAAMTLTCFVSNAYLCFDARWCPSFLQVTLAKPIITLLSKEYHHKQSGMRPNIIQVCVCVSAGARGCVHVTRT